MEPVLNTSFRNAFGIDQQRLLMSVGEPSRNPIANVLRSFSFYRVFLNATNESALKKVNLDEFKKFAAKE